MSDDALKKHEGQAHTGPDHAAPYPLSRLAPGMELVDLAKEIAKADTMLNVRAHSRLKLIAEQIRQLQQAAKDILEETRRDQDLHRAQCNFKRIPGRTYHLYAKADGSRYFSMLSPADWRGTPPHAFLGAFRLENDMSWTPADQAGQPDDTEAAVRALLEGGWENARVGE